MNRGTGKTYSPISDENYNQLASFVMASIQEEHFDPEHVSEAQTE